MKTKYQKFKAWLCSIFGHSFSFIDVLTFRLKCEGRCYTVNTLTGERRPCDQTPEITCRRCGEKFQQSNQISSTSEIEAAV